MGISAKVVERAKARLAEVQRGCSTRCATDETVEHVRWLYARARKHASRIGADPSTVEVVYEPERVANSYRYPAMGTWIRTDAAVGIAVSRSYCRSEACGGYARYTVRIHEPAELANTAAAKLPKLLRERPRRYNGQLVYTF